jgi:hypothetical protein
MDFDFRMLFHEPFHGGKVLESKAIDEPAGGAHGRFVHDCLDLFLCRQVLFLPMHHNLWRRACELFDKSING